MTSNFHTPAEEESVGAPLTHELVWWTEYLALPVERPDQLQPHRHNFECIYKKINLMISCAVVQGLRWKSGRGGSGSE